MASLARTVQINVTNVPYGGKFQVIRKLAQGPSNPGVLVQGTNGAFYGIASGGYSDGAGDTRGLIFKMTSDGTLKVLHYFSQNSQCSDLIRASNGKFYGTCSDGTIYRLSADGTFTSLTHLGSGVTFPSGLVQGADGFFYGTTFTGGSNDLGTVFKMAPDGTITALAELGGAIGGYPSVGLTMGADGWLYGVTEYGNSNGFGGIFKINTAGTDSISGSQHGRR